MVHGPCQSCDWYVVPVHLSIPYPLICSTCPAFSPTELRALSQTPIILVKSANGAFRHLTPTQCYFKGDSKAQFHSKLFTFVDFGLTANTFLSACGVKHEPSVEEIAKILLDNPRHFYDLSETREKYGSPHCSCPCTAHVSLQLLD